MKEKTRPLSKLYSIVFRRANKTEMKDLGICSAIDDARIKEYITPKEYRNLILHFEAQRPSETLHKEFYYPAMYFNRKSAYWWTCTTDFHNGRLLRRYNESVLSPTTIRSRFLRHMIQITK